MTAAELAEGAKCLECQLPPGMEIPALIYVIGASVGITDVNTIIAGAVLMNKIPAGMQLPALIYLMDRGVNG